MFWYRRAFVCGYYCYFHEFYWGIRGWAPSFVGWLFDRKLFCCGLIIIHILSNRKRMNNIYESSENEIHSTAIISMSARIGKNNYFAPGVIVGDNVVIGDNNYFGPYCIIGEKPESREFFKEAKQKVIIGDNNKFYKQVTVDGSTNTETIIMSNCELLKNSHVGHDAYLWDGVSLRCNAVVGGFCVLHKGVIVGMNASIHQRVEIKKNTIIGGGSFVTRKQFLDPDSIYGGVPVRKLKKRL